MTRAYQVPERLPGEGNWEWCQRVADSIPPEAIVRALIRRLEAKKGRRRRESWSFIGELVGHGSGVSQAIVEKYS